MFKKKYIEIELSERQNRQYELIKKARGSAILLLNKETDKVSVMDPQKWEIIDS